MDDQYCSPRGHRHVTLGQRWNNASVYSYMVITAFVPAVTHFRAFFWQTNSCGLYQTVPKLLKIDRHYGAVTTSHKIFEAKLKTESEKQRQNIEQDM